MSFLFFISRIFFTIKSVISDLIQKHKVNESVNNNKFLFVTENNIIEIPQKNRVIKFINSIYFSFLKTLR